MTKTPARTVASLAEWRREAGLSQVEASAFFGVTQAHWSRLENGLVGCRPPLARRISRFTGVAFEKLLNFGDSDSGGHAGVRQKRSA